MKTKNEWRYLSYSKFLEEACFGNDKGDELRFNKYDIMSAWIKYGGSFVRSLGEALAHADVENTSKIMDTWNNYIIEYYYQGLLNSN